MSCGNQFGEAKIKLTVPILQSQYTSNSPFTFSWPWTFWVPQKRPCYRPSLPSPATHIDYFVILS